MAAPGSSFVNCTALSKNLGVRPPVTLIEESPWEVDPGGIPSEAISSLEILWSSKVKNFLGPQTGSLASAAVSKGTKNDQFS